MTELLGKRIHPLTLNFVNLIVRNRRELLLADVARNFIDLYERSKSIKRAHVVSATAMDDSSKHQLQRHLNVLFKANVQMSADTNPNLIGGFILCVGDRQYDASMSSALERMRKTLNV